MAKQQKVNVFTPKSKRGKSKYKKNLNKSEKRNLKEYVGQGR
jgi:hypothetical protein